MRLEALIQGIGEIVGEPARAGDIRVCDITEDSRTVMPGSMFIARQGLKVDGRAFIVQAARSGASSIVIEGPASDQLRQSLPAQVVLVSVKDAALATAMIAERFYGQPSGRMSVVGVTGTNGKSTIAHLVHRLLSRLEIRCGLIGTIEVDDGSKITEATHTTPPATELSRTLSVMVEHECKAVAMEVSSHALEQQRPAALRFAVGIFTNLTGDHLDYHPSMEAYAQAKARLFAMLPNDGFAILNAQSQASTLMAQACRCPLLVCGPGEQARVEIEQETLDGQRLRLTGPWGEVRAQTALVGAFNAMNTLQAVAAVHRVSGASAAALGEALQGIRGPAGRLEPMHEGGEPVRVLVDYAHSDDALANAISAVRSVMDTELAATGTSGRLWVVFGAGGDRDRTKRPRMGKIASELADLVVVTSDNPRSEQPSAIIDEILAGVPSSLRGKVAVHPQRDRAIEESIRSAQNGDVVLIAGKGHERDQLLPDGRGGIKRIAHDDRVCARTALERMRLEIPRR